MKKFCNKLSKQQWRVSVPNINSNLFRRSASRDECGDDKTAKDKTNRVSAGSYDLEEAERAFDRCSSVPDAVFQETTESSADSSTDDNYEDARASSGKQSTCELASSGGGNSTTADFDSELYTDIVTGEQRVASNNLNGNNSKFEYDVPKIHFSFFEDAANARPSRRSSKHKTELKIVLAAPKDRPDNSSKSSMAHEDSDDFPGAKKPVLGLRKSGSDPNIRLEEDEDDGGLYKVPKSLKRNRLSMSLNDFNLENHETIGSSIHSSIEHVSCSQVLVERIEPDIGTSAQNSASDYCKVRSRLPPRIRRVTFLRKPKNKAVDTWTHLKTKMNNIMEPKSSGFGEKEKLAINLEEMYKHSKDRCKQVFKNTSKMFKARRDTENLDPNIETSSQIVKNDAFFAKVDKNDIRYKLNTSVESIDSFNSCDINSEPVNGAPSVVVPKSADVDKKEEFDFNSIRSAFRRSKFIYEGQNGFDDIRRYVKQGADFCKELSTILQERSEAEIQYAKSLSKLSCKLAKACREGVGDLNESWRTVAIELEARAEGHRLIGTALLDDAARPLRNLNESQHRTRKQAEASVDKAARNLADWRAAEAKSKKHSHTCARDNEKLQDAMLDNSRLPRSTSLIHLAHIHGQKAPSDKENAKLEGKKKKAEDAVKKADIEYYTLCVRAERARLEWESAVLRSSTTFQTLEEERLNNLKSVLNSYLHYSNDLTPRLIAATDRLRLPMSQAEPAKDLSTFVSLRQSSQQTAEQLLPDFYCEHITLAMNRERRKQALVKLLHLIRQDIDRERKSKNGLENLSRAIKQTPNFGAEDSQQSVTEKLYHMKSMLTYLEGARYKLQNALAELDSRPRTGHPLAPHITTTRDKSGLQQSVLKVPQWLREQYVETERSPVSSKSDKQSPLSEKSEKSIVHIDSSELAEPDWNGRGTADGNSNQPDSDFDEFSSQGSSAGGMCVVEESPVQPISRCRALYAYTPNLPDELHLQPGDVLSVYRQQEDGWWLGECNGAVGIFPATYVETIAVAT